MPGSLGGACFHTLPVLPQQLVGILPSQTTVQSVALILEGCVVLFSRNDPAEKIVFHRYGRYECNLLRGGFVGVER